MAKPTRANRDLIRAINRSTVLNAIKTYGPIARTNLSKQTGLSQATISGITGDLINNGIVFEKEAGVSSGGRRPVMLALNPQGGYVVGVKLTKEYIVADLTDLEATSIARRRQKLRGKSVESVAKHLAATVTNLIEKAQIPANLLLGVGVGLAGVIDAEGGVVRYSPAFGWNNVDFEKVLEQHLAVPVSIDNDVNTLTLAEQLFGAGQGRENFLVVTIGRGVGLGIILHGQLHRGVRGGGGEFGHTIIDSRGPACTCGKLGCLEMYASDPAIWQQAREAIKKGQLKEAKDLDELQALGEDGDAVAIDIYAQAGDALAQGISNLINILDPNLIILSGEGVRAGDLIVEPIKQALPKYVMPSLLDDTEIRVDAWDDDAWARGAASLVLSALFESPMHSTQPVGTQTLAR